MLLGHHTLQTQKVLNTSNLIRRIHDQPFAANEQQLRQRKVQQPVLQVARIDANLDRSPVGVHHRVAAVDKGQLLEALHVRLLAGRLRVVRDGASHRISHHN